MSLASIFRKLAPLFAIPMLLAGGDESPEKCWHVSAEFLYWYPSEEVASIWADVIAIGDNTSSWDAAVFDFKWDYGFKLEAGRLIGCDCWDTALRWTWFQTHNTEQLQGSETSTVRPEFFAAFLSGETPSQLNGNWKILFNAIDWELGRRTWIGSGLLLRPFIGLKAGWIRQFISVDYLGLILEGNTPSDQTGHERLSNNFWGIGPHFGVDSKWIFNPCGCAQFSLIGDVSLGTLWGWWECEDNYSSTVPKHASVSTPDSSLGALMVHYFLGLGVDIPFCQEAASLSIQAGFESQVWFNQLRIATFQLQRLRNDLTLQGLTMRCGLDF